MPVAIALSIAAAAAWAAEPRYDRGRLFRIDRPGLPASYVFGTLHSDDPRVAALPTKVSDALGKVRTAAFETLLVDRDVAEFAAAARYEDQRRLTDHLDAAKLDQIRTALGWAAPPESTLVRTKPWAILLMLAQSRDGGSATLDGVLLAEAKARRLAAFGLELPDEQVASLDAIPLASQLALMNWALDSRERRAAELEATTRAWLAGDLARLWAMALRPGTADPSLAPHFESLLRHLVTNRNTLLAHRLHLPLARGRVFVAVGALHLFGAEGLLALIARQGYRVTRLMRGTRLRAHPGHRHRAAR